MSAYDDFFKPSARTKTLVMTVPEERLILKALARLADDQLRTTPKDVVRASMLGDKIVRLPLQRRKKPSR